MNRNPLNTAVFLVCFFAHPENPKYQDMIRDVIRKLQKRGYEPYLYSASAQLMDEANLFIHKETGNITQETRPFWKDHNIILTDCADIVDDYFDIIVAGKEEVHRFFGLDPFAYGVALLFDRNSDLLSLAMASELPVVNQQALWINSPL